MSNRLYVGVRPDLAREAFWAKDTPTHTSHGNRFSAVIGPFRTKAGAEFMRDHGQGNPHCRCVADAERIAMILRGQSELCAAEDKRLRVSMGR